MPRNSRQQNAPTICDQPGADLEGLLNQPPPGLQLIACTLYHTLHYVSDATRKSGPEGLGEPTTARIITYSLHTPRAK